MSNNNLDIMFCDLEVSLSTQKIFELGFVYKEKELKTTQILQSLEFVRETGSKFLAGHNFIDFDLEKLKDTKFNQYLNDYYIIDTLPLSLLLFNEKTHHSLPKNYKSEDDFRNDPVEDSKITRKLFIQLKEKFKSLKKSMQYLFYSLLHEDKYFKVFLST